MLELSDTNFKSAMIKILQQAVTYSLETNEKVENLSKRNRSYKKEPNGNYIITEKYNNQNLKLNQWA